MKWEKIAYHMVQAISVGVSAYILLLSGSDRYWAGPLALLFLLVPPLAEKLFGMRLGYPLKITVLVFSVLAFHLGVALRWYDRGWGYDNMVHCLSGILFTLVGLCLYARVRGGADRREEPVLQITYAFFFSMFVAVLWEIGEFSGFLLLGHDAQHHLDTGVFDTMEDIIACFWGSLVMALDYLLYYRRNMGLLMTIVKGFDAANHFDKAPKEKAREPVAPPLGAKGG